MMNSVSFFLSGSYNHTFSINSVIMDIRISVAAKSPKTQSVKKSYLLGPMMGS